MLTKKRQRGQAMAEYFVATGIVLGVLVTPVKMNGNTDTVLNFLIANIQSEQAGFMWAIQPPQPK